MSLNNNDPLGRALANAEEVRAKMPNDAYDPNVPFQRRIILSPLAVLGVVIACAVIGMVFFLFK